MSYSDTILADTNGGTLALNGEPTPTTGYFVGGLVSALIVDGTASGDAFSIDFFGDYLRKHTDAAFIGWWTDFETGQLWVDGSDWFPFQVDAEREGRARGEIAIYDVANQKEIRL